MRLLKHDYWVLTSHSKQIHKSVFFFSTPLFVWDPSIIPHYTLPILVRKCPSVLGKCLLWAKEQMTSGKDSSCCTVHWPLILSRRRKLDVGLNVIRIKWKGYQNKHISLFPNFLMSLAGLIKSKAWKCFLFIFNNLSD